jgi:integrase
MWEYIIKILLFWGRETGANLRREDVDFDNKVLTVRQGKGKKDRQIPLVDDEVKALRNYLRYRASQLVLDELHKGASPAPV